MADYFYDKEKKEIFIYDSLTAHQLNETAAFILEQYLEHIPLPDIIYRLSIDYEVNLAEATQDVQALILEFKQLGIDPTASHQKLEQGENIFDEVQNYFHLHTPIVHIIQNCNSPCKMCDCWQTKEKIWHPAGDLKKFFEKVKHLGAKAIMLSGGEPLLHPELRQIISDLKEIGLKVMLNTNALLLHKHLWIAELEIEQLVVSMDGYDSTTYQTYRGLNGYHIVWNNLELFQKKSPFTHIGIRTILNKHNYNKMDLIYEAIESRGMHSVGLSPADVSSVSFSRKNINPEKEQALISLLLPSEEQIFEFLRDFTPQNSYYQTIKQASEKGLSSWTPYDFIRCMLFYLGVLKNEDKMFANRPCYFPYTSMVLDYNGDFRNCFYSSAFGNLYQFDSVDWSFQHSMKELKQSGKCQSCRGNVFCGSQIPQTRVSYA